MIHITKSVLAKFILAISILIASFMTMNAFAAEPQNVSNSVAIEQPTAEQPATVNINTASAIEIEKQLLGIGAKRAQLIIDYREKHGNFATLEQLLEIKGIGPSVLEKNKGRIAL